MSRKMLINGQRAEELRVAIVENNVLEEYEVEHAQAGLCRGNIYRGVVANIARSLNAAFVDFGESRQGFLSVGDVIEQAYHRKIGDRRPKIEDILERGKPLLVQVTKDAVGSKGAQVTTNVSIAGRYLVLRPFDPKVGVSRKVDDDDRAELQEQGRTLDLPKGFGYIVRTNAVDQTKATLTRDATALIRLWRRILEEARVGSGPRQLYGDQDLIVHAMRDYLDATISEVLIDDDDCYEKATSYVRASMPRSASKLQRYTDRVPLFSRYRLDEQIESIYSRKVTLPSGGSIVIDPTEALTAIDVNSARSKKGANQDETALFTNLEAAEEVARQLRLRDIGGLTVVDFIDMRSRNHQRDVERALRDAMKRDKARVKLGKISPNGLLEINRQRIKQAIQLRTSRACPTCKGIGHIPAIEMVGLSMLRRIEARAAAGRLERAIVKLHPEVAQAVQNLRRRALAELEKEFEITIEIVSDPATSRSEESIEWKQLSGDQTRPKTPPQGTKRVAPPVTSAHSSLPDPDDDLEEPDEELEETSPGPVAAPAAGRDEDEHGEPKRRRRRRRRKPASGEAGRAASDAHEDEHEDDEADLDADLDADLEASQDEPSGAPAALSEAGEEDRPKRRRRGRRRRRPGADESAESGEHAAADDEEPAGDAQAATAKAPAEPTSAEADGDEADEEEEAKPRRRRRSRRRRPKAEDMEPSEAEPDAQGEASARAAADHEAEPDAEPPVAAVADEDAEPLVATEETEEDDAPVPVEEPAPPAARNPRRRRRPRPAELHAAIEQGEHPPASDAPTASDDADPQTT